MNFDFLDSKDWLGREGPYAYQWDHLLFVFVPLILGVLLAFFLKGKSKTVIRNVMIGLWAFGTVTVFTYYITLWVTCAIDPTGHPFNIVKMLPLHSCLMFIYIFPIAIFVKNKYIKTMALNFLVVVNMIMGFITLFVGCPPKGSSVFSMEGIQSMVIHVIIVIVPLIMLITNYYDLKKGDLKWGLMLFGILAISIYTFDAITGCDYFFFYDGRTFGVLYVISENVPHIVWTLIVVTCYVLTGIIIHYLIYGIKLLIEKKKLEKAPVEEPKEEGVTE